MDCSPLEQLDFKALGIRLREAREARGHTQEEVAKRLGLSRTTMVAIEKGERRVRPRELVDLARVYGRQVADLVQRKSPVEGFVVQLRAAMPPGAPFDASFLPHLEEFQSLCEDYQRLEEICEAPMPRRYPAEYDIRSVEPESAAEDAAASERGRLALGDGPILNLRGMLEADVGLRVFQIELPSRIAGLFAFTDELGGCLACNLGHPPERRGTSLAHEYGHFLTNRYRSEITFEQRYERRPSSERFAEAFARAFLMPAAGLRRRFLDLERTRSKGVTHGDLCRLAHFFAVSVEGMTRRLEELRLIPSGTWERLRIEGFRVREAQRILGLIAPPADNDIFPPRYVALAIEAWQRESLSEGQLVKILRTDRLGARERVRDLEQAIGEDRETGEGMDLTAPLFRRAS